MPWRERIAVRSLSLAGFNNVLCRCPLAHDLTQLIKRKQFHMMTRTIFKPQFCGDVTPISKSSNSTSFASGMFTGQFNIDAAADHPTSTHPWLDARSQIALLNRSMTVDGSADLGIPVPINALFANAVQQSGEPLELGIDSHGLNDLAMVESKSRFLAGATNNPSRYACEFVDAERACDPHQMSDNQVSDVQVCDIQTSLFAGFPQSARLDMRPLPNQAQVNLQKPASVMRKPSVADKAAVKLRLALQALAEELVAKAANSIIADDPILGPWSNAISVGARVQKQHGRELPKATAMILEYHGFKVWENPKIALSESLLELARYNDISTLQSINYPKSAGDRLEYEADLIVYCPITAWAGVFDGKRGGGASDSISRDALVQKMKACYLTLPTWLREKRLQSSVVDVRIIDYFGQSKYKDDIAIRGGQIDDYFGCNVEEHLAYFNACCRIAASRLMSNGAVEAEDADLKPEDLMVELMPSKPNKLGGIFKTNANIHPTIKRFEDSRAMAISRLHARRAA